MMSSNVEAATIQQAIVSPVGFKIQALGLLTLYVAAKVVKTETRHF